MGGSEGGKSAGVWRWREFFPIALRERAGAAPRGSRPWSSNLLILLNFFRLVDRHSFRVSRHAARWAGLGNSVNCVELWKRTISNSGIKRDGKKHICKERSNIFFLAKRGVQRYWSRNILKFGKLAFNCGRWIFLQIFVNVGNRAPRRGRRSLRVARWTA